MCVCGLEGRRGGGEEGGEDEYGEPEKGNHDNREM